MTNELLEFLRDVAADLNLNGAPLPQTTVDDLAHCQEMLQEIFARYEPPAPAGAESVREAMMEALEALFQSIELLLILSDAGAEAELDAAQLRRAVDLAEEGSDLLEQVEYLIAESKTSLHTIVP